ncbi:hypothetical protein NIA04_05165 [Anaerostipes hadrus]|nr:hypothetical protein [Anaerostipes hadrus]
MKLSTAIIGIVLFAIATMILYGWGIVKQKNQTNDLMNLLFSKGQDKIKKYLKQNEYITISQVEQICEGLEAKQPFSRNRAVVKDKRDYAKKLVEYMLKTNQLEKEGSRYKMRKK